MSGAQNSEKARGRQGGTQAFCWFLCWAAESMREDSRPNIAVGVIGSGTHLQVWCETHELSLGLFELKNSRRPMVCSMCEEDHTA